MPTLLRIDSSARHVGSRSRQLGDEVEAGWRARYPAGTVHRRDLATDPAPQITESTISGFYRPQDGLSEELRVATALSDTLIAELRAADVLLMTAPMYNFTVPAALKAWIDQIVRINRTFGYDGTSFTGLVTGKRLIVTCAYGSGGYLADGAMAAFDLLQAYLKLLFSFLGFTDIHFIGVEGTAGDDAALAASTEHSRLALHNALAA